MKLFTSSFWRTPPWNLRATPESSQVCIARTAPSSFRGRHLLCLAPSASLLSNYWNHVVGKKGYTKRFNRQLSALHFPDIIKHLHDGDVLLCYEAPGQFCHRHLVAAWLRKHGIAVEELK